MKRNFSKDMDGTIVFDLETQKSFADVGGRQNIPKLLLSLAVVFRYADRRFVTFIEKDASALLSELRDSSCIVGFNLLEFDYLVLRKYGKLGRISSKTVDMMKLCEKELGWRPKLDDLAQTTLGAKKGADGLQAIRLYREGKIKELERYCKRDVLLTRNLFEFGREHGFVYIEKQGSRIRVAAGW